MKVNKPADRKTLNLHDLEVGDVFTFRSNMQDAEPGVFQRTATGYTVVRAVSHPRALPAGTHCNDSMNPVVLRVQIDEITVLE